MAKKPKFDPENPPTKPADWIGATKIVPPSSKVKPIPGGVTFHLFRASTDPDQFVVTDQREPAKMPPCPRGGRWVHYRVLPETGRPRVGFSEAKAKADIAAKGYHRGNIRALVAAAE